MTNTNAKNVWLILEETLHELNFSAESTNKIKTDLEDLAKAETATRLLENLTEENQQKLRDILADKQGKERETIIQNFLSGVYNKEEFTKQLLFATRNVLKDYLEYLFNKVNDKHKKQILTNFIGKY